MSSARKIAANRKNAKASKGPKTVEGRNVVRRNALKHGLTAETLVVEGEDAEAFRLMADAHLAVFRPRNDVEVEFARTFTIAAWRRQRCVSTETSMVNRYIRDSQLAEEVIQQQDALALGDRLFFDSQDLWQLYPDRTMIGAPLSKRRNEVPGSPDLPARLVNELESSYAGCRWLLDRWNDLKVRNQPFNSWQASDKFKAIRLLGKQPLDVLHDTTGDLLAIFLGSYAVYPLNKSPFSELRCEVGDDQFPAVRRQLDAMDIERRLRLGETAGRQLLNDLIARQIRRLEQLARKHKARAEAEAAESTSRLAFDPGAAADKVRRYEDASIRRMTRACDDLAKLRRSGILDEDAHDEAELEISNPKSEISNRAWPAECETANIESGAWVDKSPSPADTVHTWVTASGGWGRSPEGDAPRSEASALGARRLLPARPQPAIFCDPPRDDFESCSTAAAQASETTVDGSPATGHGDRPASDENTGTESDAPPQESGSPAAAQASETTVHGSRSALPGNSGPWILLLLVACCWWFVASGQGAALRGSPMSPSPADANSPQEGLAICPARAVALDTRAIEKALFEERTKDKAWRFCCARSSNGASDPSLYPPCEGVAKVRDQSPRSP